MGAMPPIEPTDESPEEWRPTWGLPGDGRPTPQRPLAGRVLVATPTIGDQRFAHAVIFMLDHDESGALGLVLNAPGTRTVDEAVPQWASWVGAPELLFAGGPVNEDQALGLVRLGPGWEPPPGPGLPGGDGTVGVGPAGIVGLLGTDGQIGLVDLSREADELIGVAGVEEIRVFAGYAGWGPGQLDAELEVGAWWDADADGDDVFTRDPAGLWERVVARQGGTRALFARFSGDPSLN